MREGALRWWTYLKGGVGGMWGGGVPEGVGHLPRGIKAVVGAHGIMPEESLCLVTSAFCRGTKDDLGSSTLEIMGSPPGVLAQAFPSTSHPHQEGERKGHETLE